MHLPTGTLYSTLYVLELLIAKTDFERVGNFYLVSLVILAKTQTKVFKKGENCIENLDMYVMI